MQDEREEIKRQIGARLTEARENAGYRTKDEFADHFGIPRSTFSTHESGKRGLRPDIARKYARYLNIDLNWLLTGVASDARADALIVRGAVQAGHWNEALEWPISDRENFDIPQRIPVSSDARFGLRVRGTSMNQVYPEGSVLECMRVFDSQYYPCPGDRVIVQRTNHDNEVEATAKEIRVDDEGVFWLWPRSNDPAHQSPIPLENADKEILEVRITALVIGCHIPPD